MRVMTPITSSPVHLIRSVMAIGYSHHQKGVIFEITFTPVSFDFFLNPPFSPLFK